MCMHMHMHMHMPTRSDPPACLWADPASVGSFSSADVRVMRFFFLEED